MITRKRFTIVFDVDLDDEFPTTNFDLLVEALLNDNLENVKVVACDSYCFDCQQNPTCAHNCKLHPHQGVKT